MIALLFKTYTFIILWTSSFGDGRGLCRSCQFWSVMIMCVNSIRSYGVWTGVGSISFLGFTLDSILRGFDPLPVSSQNCVKILVTCAGVHVQPLVVFFSGFEISGNVSGTFLIFQVWKAPDRWARVVLCCRDRQQLCSSRVRDWPWRRINSQYEIHVDIASA